MKISVRVTKHERWGIFLKVHERLLTLGNELGVMEGEKGGSGGECMTETEGTLEGMSTGCYSVCWQIEHQ